MTWVKLDDSLFARADFRALGRDAKLLYLASLAHTSSQLTDGRVSKPDLAVVAAQAGVKPSVRKELEPDWWAPDEDGWTVIQPGFRRQEEWRRSAERARELSAKRAAAGKKGAESRKESVSSEESTVLASLHRNQSGNEPSKLPGEVPDTLDSNEASRRVSLRETPEVPEAEPAALGGPAAARRSLDAGAQSSNGSHP